MLAGVRVVNLGINVPGAVAGARLRDLGAEVTKLEPPGGDPSLSRRRAGTRSSSRVRRCGSST